MGGQQSARRITIDNDEPYNVIKVSEEVVERFKGAVDGNAKPNSPRSPSSTVHIQPKNIQSKTDDEDGTVTSLDVKKQYEEELKQNNEYWQNRIKALQDSQDKIQITWNEEYKRAIDDIEKCFPSRSGNKDVPCSDKKSLVISCYKKNSKQPLLCANEVQEFSDCLNGLRG
ncbi:coiled-coil-helix-coiled-coil-helix domain containing 3 [Lycorma delicatula]|uniref:coiled-coil-helix-coiled-coil-helix domain containing 3 n=1 Tax=Lycorma delicatula TaxID=130591 RepID=UPI003F519DF9